MNAKAIIILTFFILIGHVVSAQDYPKLIKQGDSLRLKATTESLYVLLKSQMKVYEDSMIELKFARRRISLLITEDSLQLEKEKIYLRDTVIYGDLYRHYYSLWDSTDHKLEATEIKLAKADHTKWNLGITGILIGVIATLLIVK